MSSVAVQNLYKCPLRVLYSSVQDPLAMSACDSVYVRVSLCMRACILCVCVCVCVCVAL